MFKSLLRRALVGATLPVLLLAPNAVAAGDVHREQIPIESWSLEPSRSGSGLSGGKVSYSDLSVMISLEKASPALNLTGRHYDRVELRAGDDKRLDYMTITLSEVMVSSWQSSGADGLAKLTLRASGTGKTMAAEVLASSHPGGVNVLLLDGSVR